LATTGAIGFGIVGLDWQTYLTGEPTLRQSDRRLTIRILAEVATSGHLIARNHAENIASRCTIDDVRLVPLNAVDAATLKRLRSQRHNYWHYTYDLGDGVRVESTLPGVMDYHRLNRQIIQELIGRQFPTGIRGLSVLDVACSSGWHSFALARMGAIVTAIDHDPQQIEQASFVQSCSADTAERTVNFEQSDLFEFTPLAPYDLVHCSGLMYHLRDPIGGAAKLRSFCKGRAVVHSCVAAMTGNYLELADSKKFIFCFQNESALVPTAEALADIFKRVGFASVDLFHPFDIVAPTAANDFLSHYTRVVRNHTAYFDLHI